MYELKNSQDIGQNSKSKMLLFDSRRRTPNAANVYCTVQAEAHADRCQGPDTFVNNFVHICSRNIGPPVYDNYVYFQFETWSI